MKSKLRCPWCLSDPLYQDYHDHEWGVPVHDDLTQFEFLVLESAQAGLSWLTILKRREGYRLQYSGFDAQLVAMYDEKKIRSMLEDPGIIRNRKKIEASVNNARCFLEIQQKFGSFSNYLWAFLDGRQLVNYFTQLNEIPSKTPLSDVISKDLKSKGFQFMGSTIVYAHLQATGLINDHLTNCFRHAECIESLSIK
jgi:DNA-3-methyladenine glycosylase I